MVPNSDDIYYIYGAISLIDNGSLARPVGAQQFAQLFHFPSFSFISVPFLTIIDLVAGISWYRVQQLLFGITLPCLVWVMLTILEVAPRRATVFAALFTIGTWMGPWGQSWLTFRPEPAGFLLWFLGLISLFVL